MMGMETVIQINALATGPQVLVRGLLMMQGRLFPEFSRREERVQTSQLLFWLKTCIHFPKHQLRDSV